MAMINFQLSVDPEKGTFTVTSMDTGETQTVKMPAKKTTAKKSTVKDDGDPTPRLTLEASKYCLNSAAARLLLDPDADENRLDIKYKKDGKKLVPVIGNNVTFGTKSGNKVTKTNTVSCRGKANEELSKYGTEFVLIPHPTEDGLYILQGDAEIEDEPEGDENFAAPEDTPSKPVEVDDEDLNLAGLLDDEDDNDTEADSFDFTL